MQQIVHCLHPNKFLDIHIHSSLIFCHFIWTFTFFLSAAMRRNKRWKCTFNKFYTSNMLYEVCFHSESGGGCGGAKKSSWNCIAIYCITFCSNCVWRPNTLNSLPQSILCFFFFFFGMFVCLFICLHKGMPTFMSKDLLCSLLRYTSTPNSTHSLQAKMILYLSQNYVPLFQIRSRVYWELVNIIHRNSRKSLCENLCNRKSKATQKVTCSKRSVLNKLRVNSHNEYIWARHSEI